MLAQIDDGDVGALAREQGGDRAADAAVGAGDQGDLALEPAGARIERLPIGLGLELALVARQRVFVDHVERVGVVGHRLAPGRNQPTRPRRVPQLVDPAVTLAKAEVQLTSETGVDAVWIPAFAGNDGEVASRARGPPRRSGSGGRGPAAGAARRCRAAPPGAGRRGGTGRPPRGRRDRYSGRARPRSRRAQAAWLAKRGCATCTSRQAWSPSPQPMIAIT